MIEATYLSSSGPNRDRGKGILAYEEMLRLGDSTRSANNLALRLVNRREFARAETLYRAAMRLNPDLARLSMPNLLTPLVYQQKFAEAESVLALAAPRYPTNANVRRSLEKAQHHPAEPEPPSGGRRLGVTCSLSASASYVAEGTGND